MSPYRNQASLAPIVVVLALFVSISLLAFIVAFWSTEPAEAAPRTQVEAAPGESHEASRGSFAPPPEPRPRSRWM